MGLQLPVKESILLLKSFKQSEVEGFPWMNNPIERMDDAKDLVEAIVTRPLIVSCPLRLVSISFMSDLAQIPKRLYLPLQGGNLSTASSGQLVVLYRNQRFHHITQVLRSSADSSHDV